MAPPVLAVENNNSPGGSENLLQGKKKKLDCCSEQMKSKALVTAKHEKPFDFLQAFYEGVIAGGTAGVVVEAALYPIDTIKTRLQAVRGGGKIIWKGLYSGLAGNLAGVLPASAIFVGIYEPAKQKLLRILPDNLSAFAHLDNSGWHYVNGIDHFLARTKLT